MSSDKSFRALKEIWDSVSIKTPDGKQFILFKKREDIEYQYCSGFVNESEFSLEEWVDSFSDSRMPNGMYLVSEEQWMDKVRFHYSGPVSDPFDPLTLREGEWSEEEMDELVREKILPSIYLSAEDFGKVFEAAKRHGLSVNGHYRINQATKEGLLDLINDCPSPRRVRELLRAEVRASRKGSTGLSQGIGATGFTKGPSASQVAAERLGQLLKKGK